MTATVSSLRIVALDPAPRGYGYGVFEGRDRLIDWGSAHFKAVESKAVQDRLETLFHSMNPDCIVLEAWDLESRRVSNASTILDVIKKTAKRFGIPTVFVTRRDVRVTFKPAKSRYAIAQALVLHFPELRGKLPPPRKLWNSENLNMNIFDAVSFAFTAFEAGDISAL